MNTSLHQNYLWLFARQEECIVFTVDYPKTPMKNYYGILDVIVWYYLYIVYFLNEIIRVKSKIILFGDSAGGNLIVSL